jgi:hypothetical protein
MKATIFNEFSNQLGIFTTRDSFMFLDNKLEPFGDLYKVNSQKQDGSL